MPRKPTVCWDAHHRRFRTRIRGKTYVLGRDYARAVERFRQLTGETPEQSKPVTVAELAARWIRDNGLTGDGKAHRWARDMLRPWIEFAGGTFVDDLDDRCLVRFHAHCQRLSLSPWTTRHYISHAARVLRDARRDGLIGFDPVNPKLQPSKYQPQDLSQSELKAFLERLDASPRRARVAALVRFILATGCRPGEARMLRWSQVRLEAGRCVIPASEHKTGNRTGEARTIYITDEIKKILVLIPRHSEFVFTTGRSRKPYSRDGFRSILSRLGVYPYQLRHTWAQNAVDQGADLSDVATLMGHVSTETTRKYARVRSERAVKALESLRSPERRALGESLPVETSGASSGKVARRDSSRRTRRKSSRVRRRRA